MTTSKNILRRRALGTAAGRPAGDLTRLARRVAGSSARPRHTPARRPSKRPTLKIGGAQDGVSAPFARGQRRPTLQDRSREIVSFKGSAGFRQGFLPSPLARGRVFSAGNSVAEPAADSGVATMAAGTAALAGRPDRGRRRSNGSGPRDGRGRVAHRRTAPSPRSQTARSGRRGRVSCGSRAGPAPRPVRQRAAPAPFRP